MEMRHPQVLAELRQDMLRLEFQAQALSRRCRHKVRRLLRGERSMLRLSLAKEA